MIPNYSLRVLGTYIYGNLFLEHKQSVIVLLGEIDIERRLELISTTYSLEDGNWLSHQILSHPYDNIWSKK